MYKRILRIISIFCLSFLILLFSILLLIQTSSVQNFIRAKAVSYLQLKLHTKVKIGKINIGFPKNIVVQDVYFEDQQHDTLFSAKRLSVSIRMLKLLHSEIEINHFQLQTGTVKIKRLLPDTIFNFQYIINAFSSGDKKGDDNSTSEISLKEIELDNIHAIYNDVVTGDDVDVFLRNFDVHISAIDLKKSYFEIPDIRIEGLQGRVYQNAALIKTVESNGHAASALPGLKFKNIEVQGISLDYKNIPGGLFALVQVGKLNIGANIFDLEKKVIRLDKFELTNSSVSIRLGKTQIVKKNIPVTAQTAASSQILATTGWQIGLRELLLDDNNIAFDDDNSARRKYGMDYSHLKISRLIFHMDDFSFSDDAISGNISKGSFLERSNFNLEAFQGKFLYSKNTAYVEDLKLQTPGSFIQRSLVLHYPSLEAIKKDIGSLVLDVDLRESKIQAKDILTFVPALSFQSALKDRNAIFLLNVRITGSIRDMKIEQLQFSGLKSTKVDLKGNVKDLTNASSMNANLAIRNITSTRNDVLSLIPKKDIPSSISIPETFELSGNLKGGLKNIATVLSLISSEGNISVRGNFMNLNGGINMGYNATITTENLNLGFILKNDSIYGNITAEIKGSGWGIDPKTATAEIGGSIKSAVYKKYNYKNASIKASIANQHAKAAFNISDPNLSLKFDGSADFTKKYPAVRLSFVIDSIKTKALHFSTDDIAYQGIINADFPVSDPDHLEGQLVIENSSLFVKGRKISLDTIKLSSGQTDSGEFINLYTEVLNAGINGHYNVSELGTVFQQIFDPYFENRDTISTTMPYDFTVSVNVFNRPLLKTFFPALERLDPIHFGGHYTSDNGWNTDLNIPLIIYGDKRIQNLKFHAKPQSGKLVVLLTLGQLVSGKSLSIYNTSVGASISDNKIDFALNVQNKAAKDEYHIAGLFQKKDSGEYLFSLKPEKLLLNYEKWEVAENNSIEYSGSKLIANNFNLKKGSEELDINSLSNENDSSIEIKFNKFMISTISGFAGTDSLLANGELNGNVIVRNATANPTFTSDLAIQNLSVYKDTVGDIGLKVSNTKENKYSADVTITGRGNDVALKGDYFVKQDNNSNFNFNLEISKLELNSVAGASGGALKSASGSVNGKFSIKGTIDRPVINGYLAFEKAGIIPAMLNSYFFIDGQKFEVDNEGINFDKFTILDSARNKMFLDGNISTSDYKHYQFNLSLDANNFQALNSTQRDNKLYYGRLFFNSDLRIKGTELNMTADGTIHINNKTKLTVVLPQEEPGIEERHGIVRFVDMRSSGQDSIAGDSLEKSAMRGLDLSANIIIDSSAELALVVDQGNGDNLIAKGTARLTGGIDKSGNTTLSGTYQLTHGSYDLTFSLLHRKFEIQNGSTITWTGEPTKANLNINAIYIANTSPIDLVSDQISQVSNTNAYLQKLPFYVYLKMKGELLKPEISFDIVLPADKATAVSTEVVNLVQARLQMLRQDQGEMNKQVFALLLLNRFAGDDPFASSEPGVNAGSLVRQSVSRILSQQLNRLATNLIHGVDINFDLESTDDYTTGQLQSRADLNVAVSKQLLNDRLKVSVGPDFELEGPQNVNANQQSNNFAGNMAIDYKLSKDGRYLLRAYRKNDYDDVIEGYVVETGMGFIITIDYNHFKEIFQNKAKELKANKGKPQNTGDGENE